MTKQNTSSPIGTSSEERLLTRRLLRKVVPVSDMTIWRWERAGLFPRHISIHGRNYWLHSAVMRWMADQASDLPSPADERD
jgi:prophage regulatory protein